MWIFLNNAMISAVEHRENPRILVVRARLRNDLERVFQRKVLVTETPDADYRFRTYVSRSAMLVALARSVDAIDYDNFKNSVHEHDRHDAYLSVWSAMNSLQTKRHGARKFPAWTSRGQSSLFSDDWNIYGTSSSKKLSIRELLTGDRDAKIQKLAEEMNSGLAVGADFDDDGSAIDEAQERLDDLRDAENEISDVLERYGFRLTRALEEVVEDDLDADP